MYSMTGYGRGECTRNGLEIRVEIKSVNNRYLDIAIKGPRMFLAAEETIRAAVRESISRGHLDLFVSCKDDRARERAVSVDGNVVLGYAAAAREICRLVPEAKNDLTVSSILRLPDVVRAEEQTAADEETVAVLKEALLLALRSLSDMRHAEGERLKADLLSRMETIGELRERIAARAPLVAEAYGKKLAERVTEYLGGKVDETRLLTEAAVFADKCNIDEELTRLSSHIREFYAICESERVGRKLDFLIQEFNRECNTICSKSNDREVTAAALEMKNEIEKVREQIQNLE